MTTDTTAFDPAAAGWALVEDKGFIAHVRLMSAAPTAPTRFGPSRSTPT
ncbi:hypothetical protein GGQ91_002306 [Methylobacterium fujisawaense]|uniref:Uncharacterized protein n=1 Tax=Methylobacterium fujisawaense TaxID=107400 RepID=A0ABR6DAF6_9HYPH|nr:hypothetical protein [Methylobacterium fujisawaense]